MKITQCQRILDYIRRFGAISTLEAYNDLGVTRLASRIHNLKEQGYNIVSSMGTAKNRYGETVHFSIYRLKEDKEKQL